MATPPEGTGCGAAGPERETHKRETLRGGPRTRPFFWSTRRPNSVLNDVKITHMDSQTSENDRSNTQMMLPDAFLIISSHFVKFCDFSKKSIFLKIFRLDTLPWNPENIRRNPSQGRQNSSQDTLNRRN